MMTLSQALQIAEEYRKSGFISTPSTATKVLADFIRNLVGEEEYKRLLNA